MPIAALPGALVLVAVHLFTAKLRFLDGVPRSRWLSGAGGVSVAYVFVHLLPELAEAQATTAAGLGGGPFGWLEHEVWVISLTGLVVFYGLDRLVDASGTMGHSATPGTGTNPEAEARASAEPTGASKHGAFWVHLGSFAVYNGIVGYLLVHREQPGLASLLLFATAMALHFVVTDFGLNKDYHRAWHRIGRWALAAAVLGGWALGAATEVPEAVLDGITAFLGGGVVLNVLKEELPKERRSRFGAFLVGVVGYTAILLLL